MSHTISYTTNLSPSDFNLYYSGNIALYTLSNLTIGFLAYDIIFSRFNLDRDNIIFICATGLSLIISSLYLTYMHLLKIKIINSFDISNKNNVTLFKDEDKKELENTIQKLENIIKGIEVKFDNQKDKDKDKDNVLPEKIITNGDKEKDNLNDNIDFTEV